MKQHQSRSPGRALACGLALLVLWAPRGMAQQAGEPEPGARGGVGLALKTVKALTVPMEGPQWIDNAVVVVKDGRIEAIGPARSTPIPAGYVVRDVGQNWVMPGMIDLHSHVGGSMDINDMVYLVNSELRVQASVVPANPNLQRAVAGGVTTVLFIPGSGTNCGGQGVLIKTAPESYDEALVRDPGSLKVAQWGNPERWGIGVSKTFENYSIREMFTRGVAYAKAWRAFERGEGPKPAKNLQYEPFRDLYERRMQVSVHTQLYQVVLTTLTMIKGEFDLPVFTDHSEIYGWLCAPIAEKMGVPAIVGPRSIDTPQLMGWLGRGETNERIQGLGAGWQQGGHTMIGFNTDAPVVPQEELFLQSALAGRYGMDFSKLENVRGLTIIPAKTAGIDNRVGSLEPGKDADIVVLTGNPSDPRTSVEGVYVHGRKVYDPSVEQRRF